MQPPDGKAALVYTTKEDLAKTLFLKLLCINLPPKFRMVFLGLPSALSRQSRDDPDRPDSNLSSSGKLVFQKISSIFHSCTVFTYKAQKYSNDTSFPKTLKHLRGSKGEHVLCKEYKTKMEQMFWHSKLSYYLGHPHP